MKPIALISLGGSLVCPDEIDTIFLKKFKNFINRNVKKWRFIIVVGGGGTNRTYNKEAKVLGVKNPVDLDWIGIASTRLNAQLVRSVFGNLAEDTVQYDPYKRLPFTKDLLIGAGFRPGYSTDFGATVFAETYGVKRVVNLSDIDFVYDSDPKKNKKAKKLEKISWVDFRKLVGNRWTPRLSMPFDPIAAKLAEVQKLQVVIADGRNLKNLENILAGKKFKGTTIN